MLASLLWSGAAVGQDLWQPDPLFPRPTGTARQSLAVLASIDGSVGYVPPFRVGERDRTSASVAAGVHLGPVEIRAGWEWLADVGAARGLVHGPGDLRLGTVVTLARRGEFDLSAGWEAKLPNAADEGELGTDETDIRLGAGGGWRHGPVSARIGVGLAVLGNPLRFANQDDVPMIRTSLAWERGSIGVIGRASADLPTVRNPARIDGDIGFRLGVRWFGLVHGGGGFVPASADWHAGVSVGFASALPERPSGV